MDQYASYIQKLKQTLPKTDFDSLYRRLEERHSRKTVSLSKPLISVAAISMLLLLTLPLAIQHQASVVEENTLQAYVFQNDAASDHTVANFVLND